MGEPPQALAAELSTDAPVPQTPRQVAIGLPSQLAERRPDIRQAEARLHAATASIGVAKGIFIHGLPCQAASVRKPCN